jgi:hypothetical protein
VPPFIRALLLGGGGHGLTDDPATDLLRLELDLRRYARFLDSNAADAAEEVAYGRDAVTLAESETGLLGRQHRRRAVEYLAAAAVFHRMWTDRHVCVRSWISMVRQFVIDVDAPDGLLAEAAAGWQRHPDVPSFVVVFRTMTAFIADNPSRGDPTWWAYRSSTPGGVPFGQLWRRDGDDDDPRAAPLPRSGPWHVAYLPQTGEVYAVRRAGRRPERVWLLSDGWHEEARITQLLDSLVSHMREPNSIILAARVLYTVRHNHETTGHMRLREQQTHRGLTLRSSSRTPTMVITSQSGGVGRD